MSTPGHGNKAVLAAMTANGTIAVAKFIGFALTGASSMLAEAIHSVADTGNQALLLLGGKRSKMAATDEHQFGYGRERYFWSFVVALVLFVLGSVYAIYEGIHKIQHPEHIDTPAIALGILGFAILAEGTSFRTAVKESNPLRLGRSWWRFIREAKTPEPPVVLLEDFGAIIGLTFRAQRHRVGDHHGQPNLGRHRHTVDQDLARFHSRTFDRRNEEPASG
ncbi:MAG: cation transporter [Acidimicrobiales bacterium]